MPAVLPARGIWPDGLSNKQVFFPSCRSPPPPSHPKKSSDVSGWSSSLSIPSGKYYGLVRQHPEHPIYCSSDSLIAFPGHLGSGSSTSPDNSLLSPAQISLYTNTLTDSSSLSPLSPQAHAYTQLTRQYQQCQDNLKKVNQDYECLKYVTLFYKPIIHILHAFIELYTRS